MCEEMLSGFFEKLEREWRTLDPLRQRADKTETISIPEVKVRRLKVGRVDQLGIA